VLFWESLQSFPALAQNGFFGFKTTIIGRESAISPFAVIYSDVEIGEATLIGDHASIEKNAELEELCCWEACYSIFNNARIGIYKNNGWNQHTGNMQIGFSCFH